MCDLSGLRSKGIVVAEGVGWWYAGWSWGWGWGRGGGVGGGVGVRVVWWRVANELLDEELLVSSVLSEVI